MKTMTCRELGGECDEPIHANNFDELIKNGMEHLKVAHPKMYEDVTKASKDDPMMKEWSEKTKKAFDEKPEE